MVYKSLIGILLLVFGTVSLFTEPTFSSSAGYVFQHGLYIYKVVQPNNDKRSWYEAEEICRLEENGNLMTIGDSKEWRWFNQLIYNLTKEMDYLGKFWIGANDRRLRGVYEFIDDSPFRYKNIPWAKGEPNRPPQKKFGFEYCIAMDPNKGRQTWSDEDCFQSYGYICKSQEPPKRLKDNRRFGYAWEWNYYAYKFIPLPYDSMTWSEAELYCQEAESGHLLSIYNPEESVWVTERIRQIRQVLGFKGLWIGATDIFSRGSFKWTDRGPVNYTEWMERAPKNSSLSRKPREACVAILTDPYWGRWNEEFCTNKMPFVCKTKQCKGKSDLAFIVDASGSVTPEGFQKAKEFILKVVQGFQITNNETHVGLIRFANDADVIFGLKKHHNILELKRAVDNMLFVQGKTHTEKALDLARMTLFSQTAGSRDVPRIALVMTDGKSESFRMTSKAAARLKALGITIVTVGIGNGVDKKELIDISTSKDYVLYVESYAALSKRVKEIRERVCDEIIRQGRIRQKALEEKERLLAEKRARILAEERARILARERARKIAQEKILAAKEKARKLAEQRRLEREAAKKLAERQRLEKEKARQIAEQKKRENQRKQNNRNTKRPNNQNRNTQNQRNQYNINQNNRNTNNRNTNNRNINNRNTNNRNTNNRNFNNRNTNNRNTNNRNINNRNTNNRNTNNRNFNNRNTNNRNINNRNINNRNTNNRNIQNQRNQYNRNQNNRNIQNRYNRNRYNRNRYNQNRNTQTRYNRNRNIQNRYNRNRFNQNRNTQTRYNQNRNIQTRYNRNRYNQNRNPQNNRNQYNRRTQNNRNLQNRGTSGNQYRNRYQG